MYVCTVETIYRFFFDQVVKSTALILDTRKSRWTFIRVFLVSLVRIPPLHACWTNKGDTTTKWAGCESTEASVKHVTQRDDTHHHHHHHHDAMMQKAPALTSLSNISCDAGTRFGIHECACVGKHCKGLGKGGKLGEPHTIHYWSSEENSNTASRQTGHASHNSCSIMRNSKLRLRSKSVLT